MNLFILIVFIPYLFFVLLMIIGWRRSQQAPNRSAIDPADLPVITVIVAFRNEETNLQNLINDLLQQDYPESRRQVILVNDHSSDSSERTVSDRILEQKGFTLVSLRDGEAGKKQALTRAVELAEHEILVITDADCRLSSDWLLSWGEFFKKGNVQFAFGGVRIPDKGTLFSKLQSIEWSSLVGSGAATSAWGHPTLCSSANLAFAKSCFEEVGGYAGSEHIPSGDDEFLMNRFQEKFRVAFIPDSRSVVSTAPQDSLKAFFSQRLRWAGKWRFNRSILTQALAVFILLFQTTWMLLPLVMFFHFAGVNTLVVLICLKIALEYIFLSTVCRFLSTNFNPVVFLVLQFLYAPYVFGVGILSPFKRYSWKGREANPVQKSGIGE
jgi:poly-beta-1,6-N-acetyl-D-glucosamine synthase